MCTSTQIAVSDPHTERGSGFQWEVKELGDSRLHKIVSTVVVDKYSETSMVDIAKDTKGVDGGEARHGIQAYMRGKGGRVKGSEGI